MKIDIFCHILPQTFFDRLLKLSESSSSVKKRSIEIPSMVNLDVRFRMMDRFGEYVQVISMASPPIESLGTAKQSVELAQLANDGMAELVRKYPDRFPGFVAALPMNHPEAAVKEIDRAVMKLGATGVQIFSNVNGKPLDDPEFLPIFEKMAAVNLPIWLHPTRSPNFPDYQNEKKSKYELWWVFGWPYETSVAMARILFAGYLDRFPNLKIITHHMGAMVPYFSGRTGAGLDQLGARTEDEDLTVYYRRLKKRPQDYFKMFYADTATFGSRPAMQCGLEFFGADQVLFSSDSPFDPEKGPGYIRETIRCIEELPISAEDRVKIYEGNARKLMRLKLA
ncbi:MAG TPA: amidohydrolase family protein [Candidatus Dormibacteraeota bacterium]|nr:amidohydrolase family protein [Candidatus Dormibacteraeota bacterium]